MKTIANNIDNEIIINKSRFICKLIKVYNENEVQDNLDKIKKEYKDATHYCYAYIINNQKRFNDDKEPAKTAGLPILNVLENNDLNYILAIVIRYFGGIKLGTGGLIRAYSNAVSECLTLAKYKNIIKGKEIIINFTYDKVKLIDNLLNNIDIEEKNFNEIISYKFTLTNDEYQTIENSLYINCNDITITDNILIEK